MLQLLRILVVSITVSFVCSAYAQEAKVEYCFPPNGAKYVPSISQIIVRPSEPVALTSWQMVVTGLESGLHSGTTVLSDDHRTIIFTPSEPFFDNEQVEVQIPAGIKTIEGHSLLPVSFSFEVSPSPPLNGSPFLDVTGDLGKHSFRTQSFPPDFPSMTVTTRDHSTPGYLYFATFDFTQFGHDTGTSGAYRLIVDTNGNPVYWQHAFDSIEFDFQPMPNGQMTFFELPRNVWYAMDSSYSIVDSFRAPAPYTADIHDFELLTHHHALMLAYVPLKPYDLSKYGGKDTATFIGGVIIETDSLHNPIWIWRSWDPGHFQDTDATHDSPVTESPFDAVHPNSIAVDTDGNLLLSSRELDEVTKISRMDGHIIWRLGGKHNQFTFINDNIHFSHQHAARRIPNGNITLFDNGNFDHIATVIKVFIDSVDGTPWDTTYDTLPDQQFSRACEYNVNTNNMTATLAWHYDHDSTEPSIAMGYVQRLDNGNTLINWGFQAIGGIGPIPYSAITEVTPDKKIAFELQLMEPEYIYRAFKFPSPKYNPGTLAGASPYILLSGVSETSMENGLTLSAPYPNPSASASKVTIQTQPTDKLELLLVDPLGRTVRTFFQGVASAPTFSLELPTESIPNGTYELLLRGSSGSVSQQFIVLR